MSGYRADHALVLWPCFPVSDGPFCAPTGKRRFPRRSFLSPCRIANSGLPILNEKMSDVHFISLFVRPECFTESINVVCTGARQPCTSTSLVPDWISLACKICDQPVSTNSRVLMLGSWIALVLTSTLFAYVTCRSMDTALSV